MFQVFNIKIKDPSILKNVLSDEDHANLKQFLKTYSREGMNYDPQLGRYMLTHNIINEYAEKLLPVARELFESPTLLSSYSLFAHYEGASASLFRHIDDNACTYTIDMCVYQTEPWGLGVQHNGEDKDYVLNENEALVYYGNDQEHWRGPFPNPESQHVAMIFFHFVEADHWYHSKGPDYVNVIRKQISEQEWLDRRN
jgi:hypothetical protein